MKINISLSLWNDRGSAAGLIGEFGSFDLVTLRNNSNASTACLQTAEKLKKFARAFEILATLPEPYKEKTQRRALLLASKEAKNVVDNSAVSG